VHHAGILGMRNLVFWDPVYLDIRDRPPRFKILLKTKTTPG